MASKYTKNARFMRILQQHGITRLWGGDGTRRRYGRRIHGTRAGEGSDRACVRCRNIAEEGTSGERR